MNVAAMTDELYSTTARNIAKDGRSLLGIFPTEDDPEGTLPFLYTVGHAQRGLPELLIIGRVDMRVMGQIINLLGDKMFEDGEPLPDAVDLGGTFSLRTRMADAAAAHKDYTIQALRYGAQFYPDKEVRVQQVLICDQKGVYQGEPGIDPEYDAPLV